MFHISSSRPLSGHPVIGQLEAELAELRAKLQTELQSKTEDHPDVRDLQDEIQELEYALQAGRRILASREVMTEVIPLRYLSPYQVAPLLMDIRGLRRATGTSGGKLVVSGTEQAIDEAMRIISLLDDESALPKLVRLKLEVRITGSGGTEKPITRTLSTEGVGAAGQVISLAVSMMPGTSSLNALITPTIGPDRTITLTGNGSFQECMLDRVINQSFQVAVPVAPGEPKTVTSGSVTWDSCKVDFEVQVTATIEEGRLAVPPKPPSLNVGDLPGHAPPTAVPPAAPAQPPPASPQPPGTDDPEPEPPAQ